MTSGTRRFFQRFELFLKKYSEASKIVNTFFGLIFKRGFGDAIGRNFKSFSDLIVENQDNFLDFGEAIGSLVSSIINFFGELRESFMKALPAINYIVDAITGLVDALSSLVNLMQGGGPMGALASLFLPMALIGGGAYGMGARKVPGKMGVKGKMGIAGGVTAIAGMAGMGGMGDVVADILGPALLAGFVGKKAIPAMMGKAIPQKIAGYGYALRQKQILGGRGPVRAMRGGAFAKATLPVAGIMAADQFSGFAENQFSNTAATVGGGAVAGAAAGAAIGAFFAPFTLGASLAIGAALGAITGSITGFLQSGKAKKEAEESGAALSAMYSDGIVDLMRRGGFDEANRAIADFNRVVSDNAENIGRSSEFEKSAQESFAKELEEKINPAIEQYERNVNDLSKASGKSEKELAELANSLGIDLTSNIMNVTDMLAEMGLVVRRVGEEFDAAFANIIGRAASEMRQRLDVLNAPKIMTEAAENFRQLLVSGTQTDDDVVDFLETLALQSQTMFAGDSLGAFEYMLANVGETGSQFEAGGVFEGFDMSVFGDFLPMFVESSKSGLRDIVSENIIATLAAQGESLGMAPKAVASMLESLDEKALIDLGRRSQEADFLKDANELNTIFGQTMQLKATEEGKFGLGVDEFGKKTKDFVEGVGVLKNGTDTFEKAVNKFAEAVGLFDPKTGGSPTPRGGTPTASEQAAIDAAAQNARGGLGPTGLSPLPPGMRPPPDTFSPRRNLVNTLSQHGKFDMGIAGSRTITSAFRTNNLGSMSSDHAAGRAYDLTGNNLGLYKTSVLNAGGYADFHGAGGSRHLHVVPPEGPVGDRTTPYMGSSVSSGGSNEFNYNITVNASEGMDEMALADLVVEKIERKQRMMSERR